jgi:hypothetical protein
LELCANLAIDGAGNFFIGTCHGEVIHLAKEKDGLAANDSTVDGAIMDGGGKLEFPKNFTNVYLPEVAGLGMALQSMEDREDLRTIKDFAKGVFIPVSIGIIDHDKGRLFGRGGMGKGISSITPIDFVPHLCGEGKEEPGCQHST